MTITEVLQLVDQLVQKKTGEHLDDLEKAVVQGLWQGKTYNQIADECGYDSKNYIGDVSRKLFKVLSEQIGENVNKSNFSWTIERAKNSQFFGLVNGNVTWCPFSPQNDQNPSINDEDKIAESTGYHDLTIAPKITYFYDRTTELNTLSHWLIDQNTRLTSVLGLSGIGKTTLVKQFVDLNLQHFDIIIWKNIKLSPSLDSILTEILTSINPDSVLADHKLTQILNLFRDQKCLIILDDLQELFIKEKLAGQYKSEYRDYQPFLTMITETEHKSSLILISQEKCQEMISLDEELYPIQCLELEGLDSIDILKNYGLQDQESWSTLIQLYDGNPVYLKDIANLIKKIFSGKVSEFLKENSLILTESIQSRLSQLFERLSPIEQQIIIELSQDNHPVSREDLRESLSLSSMDLINGLDSLTRRYLIKVIGSDQVLFSLSFIIREYIKVRCDQQK
ncbi:ATP-binding protein [Planktothrix agardhii 1029]|uniref:NB-ARC domain-containing protein n=1 Tax=Planktothrix agardhii TaxID=1160 RepID=UPI001D09B798|nr:NB-ARC domain-containing protein [Planktothrix agardhii]MCB8764577.1 ATP-binding protein [Planktothrix agardhii 1809]MCB8766259.1 ATP-binding protein [Planktothrix agardhii 1809]MCB8782635.1 ATP-binding protein [Planktothrix agardhii 1808]MCF3566335.1 ATP-binding protein [Planktothrix agardhii 1807]MCF3588844.1 ATP-binding protein [Planktothrix agardhii 1029]